MKRCADQRQEFRVGGQRAKDGPPPRSSRVRETKGLDLGGGGVSALADVLGEQSHVPLCP